MQYDETQILQRMSEYVSGASFCAERLNGGGNNVLWSVSQTDDASLFVVKDYGADGSDRLDREWAFLTSLARYKIAHVPAPIWVDRHRGLACFSHLDGTKLGLEDITETHILQASEFIRRVCGIPISDLHHAKGAHYSITGHLNEIESRVSNLENSIEQQPRAAELKLFLETCLRPDWERRKQSVSAVNDTDYFSEICKMPSPSDFGFHNILCKDTTLNFVDFEYAGIDDLAKLLADFSLMPEMQLSKADNNLFRQTIISGLDVDRYFDMRLALLDFLFPVKWVCIILNVFLPEKTERILSASDTKMSQRQKEKFELATQFFGRHYKTELVL